MKEQHVLVTYAVENPTKVKEEIKLDVTFRILKIKGI
jgi:hypothetical protein